MDFVSQSFSPAELERARDVAFEAAFNVVPILRNNFGEGIFDTKKDENDWVTKWDQMAERRIRKSLGEFSCKVGILGEEYGHDGNSDTYWTIDPIDGTKHFVKGDKEVCTTMIGLVDHGVPVVGVIYNFMNDTSYTAVAGKGAYVMRPNLKNRFSFQMKSSRLHVNRRPLSMGRVELYSDEEGQQLGSDINLAGGKLTQIHCSGAALTRIAKGSLEGFVSLRNPYAEEPHFAQWDNAPGALIIHEAGGVVRNIGSEGFDMRKPDLIMANRPTFDSLSDLARQYRPVPESVAA